MLRPQGSRWEHTLAVASNAAAVSGRLEKREPTTLVASAYLHDIGYAPALQNTGFHPIDGALYLRKLGHERLARIVAHHSAADVEAALRGLGDEMKSFPADEPEIIGALTYCDMTTSSGGGTVTIDERLADIEDRYDEDSPVRTAAKEAARIALKFEVMLDR
mgnify:CR=1 FL=1